MTEDDIKFKALRYLGIYEDPDFNLGNTTEVIEINQRFPEALKNALTKYLWNDALEHAHLKEKIVLENHKFLYKFPLPCDFLFLRGQFLDKFERVPFLDYELKKDALYTNHPKVFIAYTALKNVEDMPDYFSEYLALKLALGLSDVLTGDSELKNILFTQENLAFIEAKNLDARQNPPKRFLSSPFTDVRG